MRRGGTLTGGRPTIGAALSRARPSLPRDGAGRVWVFSGLLAAAAATIYFAIVAGKVPPPTGVAIPWWLLAGLFYVAEVKVVHFHFRRDAHSFSLSELPLVLGLFFVPPTEFVLAQIVGAGAALILNRRQSPLKLCFNLAHFALEAVLAVTVFHLLVGLGDGLGPAFWLATFAATVVANVVGVLSIAIAISLSEGRRQYDRLPRMLGMAMVVSLTNTSLALVAVNILLTEPAAIWLLGVPVVTLYLAYRAYISERQKHESLELLYESSRILQRSPELDSAMVDLLDHARQMFRAERAEITLYAANPEAEALRTVVGSDRVPEVMVPLRLEVGGGFGGRLGTDSRAQILSWPEDTGEPAPDPSVRNAMLSPLRTDAGIIGAMAVVNRLGDVSSFDTEDLRLFETLANHAGVALENGQLEQSLSELSRLKEALRFQAYHDALTNLGNRSLFVEQVEERLASHDHVRTVPVVLFLDLDDFKIVNDSLGHAAGDALLVAVAERLSQCLRGDDVAARLGGDEFAILLSDTPELSAAVAVGQRIIDSLHPPFLIDDHELVVTASIGVAARAADERAEELLRNADVAMYTAKAHGKGRLALFEPTMHAAVVQVRQLSADLQRAVGRDEFVLHYQPIVDLSSGRITGLEALVRWRHPERGLVEPSEFIALAEETGVIAPIGRWVLMEACRQARLWQERLGRPDLTVAVNLSARQVQHAGFIEEVAQALQRSGLDASSLILEMTETVMLQDTTASISKLDALKRMGLRIAVDDFGTGYSSLSYLRRFPVDILKIARDFVDIERAGSDEWAFADAIIGLGRSLGMEIVAEGIESPEQLGRLRELGCQFGQGYYFARPLDAHGVESLLAAEDGRWAAPAAGQIIRFSPPVARSSTG